VFIFENKQKRISIIEYIGTSQIKELVDACFTINHSMINKVVVSIFAFIKNSNFRYFPSIQDEFLEYVTGESDSGSE